MLASRPLVLASAFAYRPKSQPFTTTTAGLAILHLPSTASDRETVTKCVHGRMLSVWCCNHNPDAGLPADATSAEDHCCVGPLEWQPAAPGCLQQHFHRVQQLSNRANCAAGEEQSTTATLQNYESSLLRLQNYQKVLLAAAAEPRGEASVTDSKCLLNSGAPHLLLNFKVRVVCLLLYTPL